MRIPITRPYIGEEEAAAAAEVVRSGWLTQGKQVQDFEEALAEYIGARHAIVVSNCTTALHLALVAAGVGPGDEVICPSFTVHRHGERHPPRRRDAGLRGHRPADLQHHARD